MSELCRICLRTDMPMQELNEKLLNYFQDICDYSSGYSKHVFCSVCKDDLKYNLDFKNKCQKSNKILQEWKNQSQKKTLIQSLHKLLTFDERKENNDHKTNCVKIPESGYFTTSHDVNDNGFENVQVKIETMKVEIKNDLFEVIDCDSEVLINGCKNNNEANHCKTNKIINDGINHGGINKTINSEINNETINNEINCCEIKNETINGENEMENNEDHVMNDDDTDDDKFLIDCVSEGKMSKKLKKGENKPKIKQTRNVENRVYPRKGMSEYSQFKDVFDIQLFETDQDARIELLQRRVSEPYLSAQYRCELCYTVYKCDKLLQYHMKWHDGSGAFTCDICSMRFAARKAMQCHKAKCHRGRFACKLCPLITYYGSAMKAHFQKHDGKIFKCHCDRVFNHVSSYMTHVRMTHASRHVCVTCARTFVSDHGLFNHRLRAHQTKSKVDSDATAQCEPCGLNFASQQVYTMHVLNTDAHKHIAKDMIACSHCGISFDDATQLKTHKKQMHPKRKDTNDTIKCKLCDASGAGRTWRWRHYVAAHPHVRYREEVSEAKLHMCERCGKRFSNISQMKDHINTHLGVKPYACACCCASFSSAASRAAHIERHKNNSKTHSVKRQTHVRRATQKT